MPNAVVTGASAGIGRELARQLVRERGYRVLVTARRRDRLEGLAAELPAGSVHIVAGDLDDADFRARLWAEAEAMPGGVDVLINNAAFGHYGPFEDEPPELIDRMFRTNVLALFDLTRRAIRHMKARGGGQVVQISSTLGFLGLPYSAAYVATKHAVNGLVKSVRPELRGTGVRVWAACPNRTISEFHGVALERREHAGGIRSRFAEPTARVARGILAGLDRRRGLYFPTYLAAAVVRGVGLIPGPYEWFMGRWGRETFRREFEPGGPPPG
jgi:short-subunit dehydrogenase